jgi:hypothetical protein
LRSTLIREFNKSTSIYLLPLSIWDRFFTVLFQFGYLKTEAVSPHLTLSSEGFVLILR